MQLRLPLIRLLINRGVNVNYVLPNKRTALLCSMHNGANFELVKVLVRAGANVNTGDTDGNSAFHSALQEGDERLVSFFMSDGSADVNLCDFRGVHPLHVALDKQQVLPSLVLAIIRVCFLLSYAAGIRTMYTKH